MVGAVIAAGLRLWIGLDRQIEDFGNPLNCRPEVDALSAAQAYRARNPDGQHHVEVQIERNLACGNRRMHAEKLRAQQALLFGGDGGEVDRMRRPHWRLRKGARQFQKNAAAGAVVGRAVVDVVALGVRVDAEVVVVRGVENSLICLALRRVRAPRHSSLRSGARGSRCARAVEPAVRRREMRRACRPDR